MAKDSIKKFENAERLEELNPKDTLNRIGFKEGMTLCDIGAGTGIFSFPSTEISSKDIYALEISNDMIELLEKRISENNIKNLSVKRVKEDILPLKDNSCDRAIMITVLHHIENIKVMIDEIKRVLKKKSKFLVIEFYKEETSMGPPVNIKMSQEEVEEIGNNNGLKVIDKFSLGDNFYGIVFEVN